MHNVKKDLKIKNIKITTYSRNVARYTNVKMKKLNFDI